MAMAENDETAVEELILRLSRSRRVFAPLAFTVGAFVMLFDGVKLLVSNWRLALVQVLPAMWIWIAMLDLKAHVLHGKSFTVLRGPVLIPIGLAIVATTVASFFLNAVFAFAVSHPGPLEIRPAAARARQRWAPIVLVGAAIGLLLALSTTVVTRFGRPWFTLSLGLVIGLMMVSYVAVPSQLVGARRTESRLDRWSASLVAGTVCAALTTPAYLLGRLGILLLGSGVLLVLGIIMLAVGLTLEAGATGAVRALKMSTILAAARPRVDGSPPPA
jgi:hypothetical protein